CNVAQPSLTRAIKQLEDELGGQLFHRERGNTHLSELGRTIMPHLRHIYDEAKEAKLLAKDFGGLRKTPLKLGIMCTIAPDQIIELIGSIQSNHPTVELQLNDANSWELEESLLKGDLEVAIYCLPGQEPDTRLHVMPLFREQMVIAISPNHRLATGKSIAIKDLNGECYIHRKNCEFAGYADPEFQALCLTCKPAYWNEPDTLTTTPT